MATTAPYFIDGLFSFEGGLNMGINPLLLQRNQLAEANNCTMRGTFVTHRPARRQIALTYAAGIQEAVEGGLYQGGCFYNGDDGSAAVFACIGGRQFLFTLGDTTATVGEITIPGDPGAANQTQAWAWQSENYLICNDGINLPFFYDGVTSRRSYGPSIVLATTANTFVAPNVGSGVTITLAAAYSGPFNIPILIADQTYQLLSATATYQAVLTNVYDVPGGTIPTASNVLNRPAVYGVISGALNYGGGPQPAGTVFGFIWSRPVGTGKFTLSGINWTVVTTSGNNCTATNDTATTGNVIVTDGQVVLKFPATAPNTTAVVTDAAFVVPARGATVTVNTTAPYVGAANAVVYIGDGQYTIAAAVVVPGTTVRVINVSDTVGTNRVAPWDLLTVPELPAGRMGVYGMGRNWVSLIDGISFLAGDIVGGSAGTSSYSYRDAVLRISENTYLNGGGVFRVPGTVGDIRAMRFATTLDASLGQGPLQVFTPTTVFSCNTPVDRTTWQSTTNPILTESLIGNGALGQHSTVAANGDTFMRSIDGLRSLILARRDFATWGNVPISHEVNPVLSADDKALLSYGSAIVFDNRLLFTASPASNAQGVIHDSTVALNFDPLSSLGKKNPPIYDGVWDGLNVLQYITGLFTGVQRAFAFALNTTTNTIELWELLATDAATTDGGVRIGWDFATCSLFKDIEGKGPFDYSQLMDGEIFVENVLGQVDFAVSYKPDRYSAWVPWRSWSITNTGTVPENYPPMGLGEPSALDFNPSTEKDLRFGYTFQIRVAVTGHCTFTGARFKAVPAAKPQFAKPVCNS